jgi:hypothetical protein
VYTPVDTPNQQGNSSYTQTDVLEPNGTALLGGGQQSIAQAAALIQAHELRAVDKALAEMHELTGY